MNKLLSLLIILSFLFPILPSIMDEGVAQEEVVNEPYIYHFSPENSFGIDYVRELNVSYFKSLFRNNFDVTLEYNLDNGQNVWIEGNQFLDVSYDWQNDSNYWKINFTFNKPETPVTVDARFTVVMNLNVLNYVEADVDNPYCYFLNYTVPNSRNPITNESEVYNCFFNWSDMIGIPDIIFNHGIQDNKFWFRFRKNDITANSGSWTFDPFFGQEDYNVAVSMSNSQYSYIVGLSDSPSSSGTAQNMSLCLYAYDEEVNVGCALYDSDYNLIAETEHRIITEFNGEDWYYFNFSEPKPNIDKDSTYVIVGWGDDTLMGTDTISIRAQTSQPSNTCWYQEEAYDGSFPDSLGNPTSSYAKLVRCHYTESEDSVDPDTPPQIENNSIANGSYEQDLDVTFTVDVYDSDGNMTDAWLNCSDGSKDHIINNGTLSITLNGSSYTQFWCNITAIDDVNTSYESYNFYTKNITFTHVANDTIDASLTVNETLIWQNVDSDYNGEFTNTTSWSTVDSSFNGSFINTSNPTFTHIANDTIDASLQVNSSDSWQTIDNDFNGEFTNSTSWNIVDSTFNGSFINSTSWNVVDNDFNGIFTNLTSWNIVDDTYNGEFVNLTVKTWQIVDSSFNGEFTNSTSWNIVDSTFNGSFINSTSWNVVDSSFNGEFTNTTVWRTVDNDFNGQFINTTSWKIIDDTFNGEFTNTSAWYIVDNDFNGSFINTTSWRTVDNTFNGSFINTTTWAEIDSTFNGEFVNGTAWQTVDSSFNGQFVNITVKTWQIVDSSFNGEFTNTTVWRNVDNDFNGSFTNTTPFGWKIIDDTFNGEFTNTSAWYIVDNDFNGSFINTSISHVIIISNVYPSNNSFEISPQPYLYATFNSTLGNDLNITWIYNISTIDAEINVTNGTYNALLFQASSTGTRYIWDVQVNDGEGNYRNETYYFTTKSGITFSPNDTGGVVGIAGAIGLIGFVFYFINKKRKKRRY